MIAAPEARQSVAQPERAGNGSKYDSKHRRCDTFRPRAMVLTQTLELGPPGSLEILRVAIRNCLLMVVVTLATDVSAALQACAT